MAPSFPADGIPEPRIVFTSLTHHTAFEAGSAIRQHFLDTYPNVDQPDGAGIVIQIQLFSGHVLFAAAVGSGPAVGPGNWKWVEGKFNTVKKSGRSSFAMKERLASFEKSAADLGYPYPEFAVAGGGIPLWIKGNEAGPVGAIIVSGLPQREDHQLIHNAVFSRLKEFVEAPSDPRYITV